MFTVVNKYTSRVYYKGEDKAEAKAAYRKDPTGSWVYFDGQLCDLRTFAPKVVKPAVAVPAALEAIADAAIAEEVNVPAVPTRTVKLENWVTLADTVSAVFGQTVHRAHVQAIRMGSPSVGDIGAVRDRAEKVVRHTYNEWERLTATSVLETLRNYGL